MRRGRRKAHRAEEKQLEDRIASARWHLARYDTLRASVAQRSTSVLSANALLVAGAGLLIPQALSAHLFGGRISVAVIGLTWVIALGFIALSVQSAIGALFGKWSWRRLFGEGPPSGLFYQHTDTLKELSSFEDFAETFRSLDANSELQSAIVGLWAGVNAHAFRYASLRRAAKRLNIAFLILLLAFAGILVLKVIA